MASRRREDKLSRKNARRSHKKRRWPIAVVVLGLGVVLVWLAPVIVAHTALKQKIVSAALSDFEGSVSIGAASLGWLSPVSARDIAAFDGEGEPLAKVKSLRSEKSLLGLLSDKNRLGVFHIDQPSVHLALREDGSNWEDALASYTNRESEGSLEEFQLQIVGGAVEVRNDALGGQWRVEDLNAEMSFLKDSPEPIRARVTANIAANDTAPGKVSADLLWKTSESSEQSSGAGQVAVRVESLQLKPLATAARRWIGDLDLQGTLTCDTFYQWDEKDERKRIQIDRLQGQNIVARASGWPGEDRLQTARLNCRGQFEANASRWRVSGLTLDTDFGNLQANGSVPADSVASGRIWSDMLSVLQKEEVQVTGEVDAARLARMLPSTLNIRSDTQIESGKLELSLASQSAETPNFTATLKAKDLSALASDRRIVWEPVVLTADFRQTKDGPVIDQLMCSSNFLNIRGKGTLAQGSATVDGHLGKMVADVGQLIDLGQLQLAGRLNGEVEWRCDDNQQFAADGRITLAEFELAAADRPSWEERQLIVDVAATAVAAEGEISKVKTASLTLQSGSDRFLAELTRPVEKPSKQTAWPIRLAAGGQLATWLPRLQPLFTLTDWRVEGAVNVDATATLAADKIEADSLNVRVDQLHAKSDTWAIDEPRIQIETKGTWDQSKGQLVANDTTMTSSTVAFRADQLILGFPNKAPAIDGALVYRADLERISRLLSQPGQPANQQLTGSATGTVRASHQGSATQLEWSADVKDLVYVTRNPKTAAYGAMPVSSTADWQEVWREPTLKLAATSTYDRNHDRLTVGSFTGTSDTLQVSAKGSIDSLCTERDADLSGQIDYDLVNVTKKLGDYLGPHVKLVGRDKAEFKLKGPLVRPGAPSAGETVSRAPLSDDTTPRPLVSPQLTASANFGWQAANIHGLHVGEGELVASLTGGFVHFEPLDVSASEGRFKLSPWIDLNSASAPLYIKKGPLVENVRISPEMCNTWLKYVAPLLAEATRAEGTFSTSLDGAEVPLTDPRRSEVHGELELHAAQIGPGPLAKRYLSIAEQVKAVVDGRPPSGRLLNSQLNISQQKIRFDVKDGRVYHQNFTVTVGDVVIRTSGSVGFDQSLALLTEVPIRDNWVADKAYLQTLKGTTLKIPVRGTMSKPDIDSRALRDIGRSMIGGAAGRLLEEGLNRGLERLISPPQ